MTRCSSQRETLADLLGGLDAPTRRRAEAMLAVTPPGSPPSRDQVGDVIDRVTGRITFSEYLRRCREHR